MKTSVHAERNAHGLLRDMAVSGRDVAYDLARVSGGLCGNPPRGTLTWTYVVMRLLNENCHSILGRSVNETERVMHSLSGRWYASGRPVFRPADDFVARSILTKCDGLLTSEFKLPFDVFCIEMPTGVPIILDGPSGRRPLRFVIVDTLTMLNRFTSNDDADRFNEMFQEACEDAYLSDSESYAKLLAIENQFATSLTHCMRLVTDDGCSTDLQFQRGDEDGLLRDWIYEPITKIKTTDNGADRNNAEAIANVVIGLALHLANDTADRRPFDPIKHEARARKGARNFDPTNWAIGTEIKLNSQTRSAAVARAFGAETAEWAKYASHVVMGHWKNQPFGHGRTERKRIHVEAYVRGNTETSPREHTYEGPGK